MLQQIFCCTYIFTLFQMEDRIHALEVKMASLMEALREAKSSRSIETPNASEVTSTSVTKSDAIAHCDTKDWKPNVSRPIRSNCDIYALRKRLMGNKRWYYDYHEAIYTSDD